MKKLRSIVAGVFILSLNLVSAQGNEMLGPIPNTPETGVLDGVYVEEHVPTKKVVPYEYLREADAIWSKRVWRVIDLREKMNLPLYYPLEKSFSIFDEDKGEVSILYDHNRRWSLWRIIRRHAYEKVMNGQAPDITCYFVCDDDDCSGGARPEDGDQFKYPLVPPAGDYTDSNYVAALNRLFNEVQFGQLEDVYDEDGMLVFEDDGSIRQKQSPDVLTPILSEQIVQYHIKEDWFFDKERSVMDVRILGIAPVVYQKDGDQIKGYERLFWIYFPECRYVFQNYFVYNRNNDSRRMSFDDVFWKRQFSSYVYKESNVHDRAIDTYKVGVDALLESEKIKEDIFKIEHDVWHF